jgi:NAD-dependent SIR2 family protein deacetylase
MIDLPAFEALALSLHHSPGVHAILVGSGLSRAAGIPTGWEITLDLVRQLAALERVTEQADWEQWYRDKYRKGPSYSELLHALAKTTSERRTILQSYIDARAGDDMRKPTRAHQAIAQLAASNIVRVVITTNFDRLIENAMREAGVEPTIIASDDAVVGATPLVHAKCTVIKVHGDYLDARIKNTDAELEAYSPAINRLLDQVFDSFGLLVVGWSGEWDTALRDAIQRAPSRRYPFYWAARGEPGALAQDLLTQRGGRSFQIEDADRFFAKLHETLEALRQASRPHPLSVEMAIALAKRYCRDDKFEMEWAEFLHAEVEKFRRHAAGLNHDPFPKPENERMNEILNSFMAHSEVLRRACLISGRWGTEAANRAVAQAIQSLSFAGESSAGDSAYTRLREFGASICFYWNMAGLLGRDPIDWAAIHALQKLRLRELNGVEDAVMVLPFSWYQVNWKFLKNLERFYAPMSVFVAQSFVAEARDIAVNEARAVELFDQTELTIGLEFAHQRVPSSSGAAMPLGQFIWKGRGQWLEEELQRTEGLSGDDPFFKAGMMGGSKESAARTIQEIRLWLSRVGSGF